MTVQLRHSPVCGPRAGPLGDPPPPLPGRRCLLGGQSWGRKWAGPRSSPSLSPSVLQSFNAYFSHEHSRLLLLWRQAVGARRLLSEVKMSTER